MAVFPSFKLTKKGEELLNRSIGEGKVLTFTKFEIGDGNPPIDFREQTSLVNKFYQFPVLSTDIQKNQILRIKGYFDNKSFTGDKQLKEIGVFVKIQNDETEYLYSYTNAGESGDIIPGNTRGFYSRTLDVANYIGYATNITFNIEQLRDKYAFNTENEMKVASYLKAGDKVELWGNLVLGDKPTDEYIIQESGEIQLNNGLSAKKVSFKYIAQTIEEMKKLALKVGDVVEVLGYYTAGDGIGHKRIISDTDDGTGIKLSNGLHANLIKEQSAPLFYETFLDKSRSFIGHRGMPHVAPENTLPSYQRAYDNNITIWETDLDLTSDGIWVLMHDNTVDRTTDGTGSINSLTLEQLKKFNIDIGDPIYQGTKIPTFEEWILLAKKLNCLPFAELKRTGATDKEIKTIVDIVKKYNMEERFAFCSFGSAVLEKVRKYSFKIQLWWISDDINQDTINWCKKVGNAHLYPEQSVITKEKVLFANSQGINIAAWTVNDPETAQKLFDYGVCLVASDFLSEVY